MIHDSFLKKFRETKSPFIINPYMVSPSTVGGWKEVGRTTLGSAGDTISVASLADKRYYMILSNQFGTGAVTPYYRINSDSGVSYAFRYSENGGADGISVSQSAGMYYGITGNVNTPYFGVHYLSNSSTKEKLWQGHTTNQSTAGAGTAPTRAEMVSKWANTTNAVNEVIARNAGGGDFTTGSEVVVLGWDESDTHTTNFWEELASVELGSAEAEIDSGTFTAKKYLWIQYYIKGAGTYDDYLELNGDTGTNYTHRRSQNGGSDATTVSTALGFQAFYGFSGDTFLNMFMVNNSANEKLATYHRVLKTATGAGTAPVRLEYAGKWANTSSQVTSIKVKDNGAGSDFDTGSILKVWGSN